MISLVSKPHAPISCALAVILAVAMLGSAGCNRTPQTVAAGPQEQGATQGEEGVSLSVEQVQKLGVATQPARAIDYRNESAGYGVVIAHDSIAMAVAELMTAQAAQVQSRAAAARAQRLVGTPGAMSTDSVESAERQLATDAAAVTLAQRRLSVVIGGGPAGGMPDGSQLQDLASGKVKLLRATFPLGTVSGPTPSGLRAAHLDGAVSDNSQASQSWSLQPVWNAPADATLPGRSFFGLLKGGDAGEGERLLVWAPRPGPPLPGVAVPGAALVISGGKYWCYVEQKAGAYVRREVATDRPIGADYFVTQGIAAGDKVVTAAAGLLLAREMNPSTGAD